MDEQDEEEGLRAAVFHDVHGDVAGEGLRREERTGTAYTQEGFRSLAGVRDGLPLMGTGSLGERLWSGPAPASAAGARHGRSGRRPARRVPRVPDPIHLPEPHRSR